MTADRASEAPQTADREWTGFEIAVVGMAGRFPGAGNVDRLWENLRDGVESISFFEREELERAGVDPDLLDDPAYVPAAGVVEGIDRFDAGFFDISPREAALMDPQHRLFLEEAYHALEHAGHTPTSFGGRIGVYGGASASAYLTRNLLASSDPETRHGLPTTFGTQADFLTTRVSYKLDLGGPSIDVQTSCSTSLVAVHLASQALLGGECDLALAGGVCLDLPEKHGYLYQEQGIYSPDGHCRAFAAGARGTVGGNGVALVVLRRLADALESGDTIHGVIRGSAINNDGSEKVGYAAPSVSGQAAAVVEALTTAGVSAESISYVEAHGTGTELGDQIEIAALTRAFREHTDRNGFCRIGSVKTNIGHLDTAAGVTGLIKVCLALGHGEIPASLHCDEPNPRLGLEATPFAVADRRLPWTEPRPLRAGVSSFGIGGTNVHLVVEEPPRETAPPPLRRRQLLITSAASTDALERVNGALGHHLERAEPELADVAFTLQTGRPGLSHRSFTVASGREEAARALGGGRLERPPSAVEDADRPVVLLLPGQGVQHLDMGRGLYDEEAEFRRVVDRCAGILEPLLGEDIRSILYPDAGQRSEAQAELDRTAVAQPAIFTIDYAAARLALASGIAPVAMAGHSLGEYVAACLAEVISLEEVLGLVVERGRLMQSAPGGSMLAVAERRAEVERMLPEELTVAVMNGPEQVVVSGPTEAVDRFARKLAREGTSCLRLATSHAFHSPMMDGIVEPFRAAVERCRLEAPRRPYLSCLTGTWITPEEATDPAYYARQLREPVAFGAVIDELLADPRRLMLETGPGRVLSGLLNRAARRVEEAEGPRPLAIAAMRSAEEERDDGSTWLEATGRLWQAGGRIAWSSAWKGQRRRRIPLPLYPFADQRHWIDPPAATQGTASVDRGGPLRKQSDLARWFYAPSFRRVPLSPPAERSEEIDPGGPCLLLADREVGPALAARLEQVGVETVLAVLGDDGPDVEGSERISHPGARQELERLVGGMAEGDRSPAWVVYLWSLDLEVAPGRPGGLDAAVDRGLLAPVFLAQALLRSGISPARLLAVSRGVHAVTGAERLSPGQAPLVGAALAISQEAPSLGVRAVDLDPESSPAESAARLLAELASTSGDRFVVHRGGHRWVRGVERLPLTAPAGSPRRLTDGGHYLIVGGTGSVGLEVAHFLAVEVGARLTLTGRREVADWRRADSAGDDQAAARAAKLREIERLGGEVATVAADATDAEAMRRAVRQAETERGPIRGVVFTPGESKEMQPLGELDADLCRAQMGPKLEGLVALDEVLAERQLDFCLVHSSLASRLGALALAPYVAAHTFVEAYVDWHNTSGRPPWSVVGWDNWLTWKEPEIRLSEKEAGLFMQPAEAREALARVLDQPAGVSLLVSSGDLEGRLARWVGGPGEETALPSPVAERPGAGGENVVAADSQTAEETLARIFGEVLGIEEVAIDDSFFELGGDSVLGLQVVSRAAAAGWRISPAALFDNPTPAALAAAATSGPAASGRDAPLEGEVPLTPIQRWFFEREVPDRSHFNLPIVVELPRVPGMVELERAVAAVAAHHDAFRLRFELDGEAVRQHYVAGAEIAVERLAHDQADTLGERLEALQRSLDIARGPVAAALLIEREESQPARLVWTAHHLLVDFVSWRILVEDLETALGRIERGEAAVLPPKTTSFGAWAEAMTEYARSATVRSQERYWSKAATTEVDPLPVDSTAGDDDLASAASVELTLPAEAARELLAGAPELGLRTDALLLAAVAESFAAWAGTRRIRVEVEAHGREAIAPEIDPSRTVGWFTALYPLLLELPDASDPKTRLSALGRQIEQVPGRGLGYGALRYLGEDAEVKRRLATAERVEIVFLYLGRFAAETPGAVRVLPLEAAGAAADPATPRAHLIEVAALATDDGLRLEIGYSRNRHSAATIEARAEDLRARLGETARLVRRLRGEGEAAEYPASRLGAGDLAELIARIGEAADGSGE